MICPSRNPWKFPERIKSFGETSSYLKQLVQDALRNLALRIQHDIDVISCNGLSSVRDVTWGVDGTSSVDTIIDRTGRLGQS
jgi:hypothetical protein